VHICSYGQGSLGEPEVGGFLADSAGNTLGKDLEEGFR